MGLHKLEIELTDELKEAVDRLSAERRLSPSEVVVETLRDHLPDPGPVSDPSIADRLAAFQRISDMVDALGISRSEEDIDRQIQEFRADREHDR